MTTYINNLIKEIDNIYSSAMVIASKEEAKKIKEINDKLMNVLHDAEDNL